MSSNVNPFGAMFGNKPSGNTGLNLDDLLSQIKANVIDQGERSDDEALDDMFASIGKAVQAPALGANQSLGRKPRVYGGPELLLSQAGFEQVHGIADNGHGELVKLPRQLLIDLLIDHSKLIAKLYTN
jgi:hypothetical protein